MARTAVIMLCGSVWVPLQSQGCVQMNSETCDLWYMVLIFEHLSQYWSVTHLWQLSWHIGWPAVSLHHNSTPDRKPNCDFKWYVLWKCLCSVKTEKMRYDNPKCVFEMSRTCNILSYCLWCCEFHGNSNPKAIKCEQQFRIQPVGSLSCEGVLFFARKIWKTST